MKTVRFALLVVLGLAAAVAAAAGTVSGAEVLKQMKDPATAPMLLDVRSPGEYAEGHVPGAVNVPIQALPERLSEVPRNRAVVVYCESGGRAKRALGLLGERGYARAVELEGSMSAWRAAGYPVER